MSFSEQVNLGLQLPKGFDPEPLFPWDRILRFHPNWFILDFEEDGSAFSGRVKDYATEKEFTISGSVRFFQNQEDLLDIRMTEPSEVTIRFFLRNNELWVQVESPDEIDPASPTLLWIRAIREYFRIYKKKNPFTLFWRFLMNRVILTMNPSQRKICLMLFRLTLLEILVIILIVIGYKIFVL